MALSANSILRCIVDLLYNKSTTNRSSAVWALADVWRRSYYKCDYSQCEIVFVYVMLPLLWWSL